MDKREQIVENMATRLRTIASGSTYETNLGNNVFVWRVVPMEESELPAIIIRDLDDEVLDYTNNSIGSYWQHRTSIDVEIIASNSTNTISDIRAYTRDINRAIRQDETWSNLALRTYYVGSEILLEQEGSTIGGTLISLRIDYRTAKYAEE